MWEAGGEGLMWLCRGVSSWTHFSLQASTTAGWDLQLEGVLVRAAARSSVEKQQSSEKQQSGSSEKR